MSQKISTEDGLLYISDDENPRQRSPRLRVSNCYPYVAMGVLFMAVSASLCGGRQRSAVEGGKTHPISTKKRVCISITYVKEATGI